ncbi:MAG: S8 family serine peptidase [Pseudomonadota bacterium]
MTLFARLIGAMALALLAGGVCASWAQAAPQRLAMGLIVKLKEGGASSSVVRLAAVSVPREGTARLRQRMAAVAQRKRVSFSVQRPTAFAASLIHSGHAMAWADAQAQANRLREDPEVEWVIVNEIVPRHALSAPNDPYAPFNGNGGAQQTWLLPPVAGNLGRADVAGAWSLLDSQALSPVVVAVLDTGVLPHPDLMGRVLPGYDFVFNPLAENDQNVGIDADVTDPGDWVSDDDKRAHPEFFGAVDEVDPRCLTEPSSWHGTAVSGMLVANTDNGLDGAGMLGHLSGGPGDARMLLPVRVSGKCGADINSIIEGLLWASGINYQGAPTLPAHSAKIINLSFGGEGSCASTGQHDVAWLYRQTIATLHSRGVLVVASAGNGEEGIGKSGATIPANCAGVLAVTGLNQHGFKARYANTIGSVGVAGVAVASGDVKADHSFNDEGIVTTGNGGLTVAGNYQMTRAAGTSLAAPQAVGVAAMMLAVYPDLSVDQLIEGITTTVRNHVAPDLGVGQQACVAGASQQGNCYCTTQTCGSGILDARAAVQWAMDRKAQGGYGVRLSDQESLVTSVSYFTPNRTPTTLSRPSSGGGGGGLGYVDLLGLALIGLLALGHRQLTDGRP